MEPEEQSIDTVTAYKTIITLNDAPIYTEIKLFPSSLQMSIAS
jgi:hypothetical protein